MIAVEIVIAALWYILPAYIANASPILFHGRTPLDQNIKFVDGRPILGKGKTVKGFVFAVIVGTFIGALQGWWEINFIPRITLAFLLSFGAMLGDAFGSFLKRRFDIKRGDAAPLLDQWGFVIVALSIAWIASYALDIPETTFTTVLAVLVLTPPVHLLSNFIAHKLGLKGVPW